MTGLLDAGPWYAYLVRNDAHHAWAQGAFERFTAFLTCEAVVSEVAFLLRRAEADQCKPLQMLQTGIVRLAFDLQTEQERILALMSQYRRASLADACLVRMSELFPHADVLTTDVQDFTIYRRNGRQRIPFVAPDS
jgi:uncharacterized protein